MAEHSHPSRLVYIVIFLALVAGTCLTWGIAFVDLGPWNPVIALAIACTKATLVILYFMHVRYSSRLIWLIISAALFWLAILFALTISDYWTRSWLPPM